ncbi:MAG: sulfite exporter TauE/SafE family protein, partial [Gemmatimonadaceae bacterium]
AIGMGVTHAAALAGIANGAAIVAGTMMILWGIIRVAELQGLHVTLPLPSVQGAAQRVLGTALLYVKAQPINVRAAITGFVTTLLPCGWLYVFVAAAAGTGNIWSGMLLMFVFWLGNVPALVAVGIGAQRAFGPLQRRLPVLSAVMVTMLGIFAVFGHMTFALGGVHHAH